MNPVCKSCPELRVIPTEFMNGVKLHGKLHYCNITGKSITVSKCEKKK